MKERKGLLFRPGNISAEYDAAVAVQIRQSACDDSNGAHTRERNVLLLPGYISAGQDAAVAAHLRQSARDDADKAHIGRRNILLLPGSFPQGILPITNFKSWGRKE